MKTYRITFQAVFDIEAESEDEALSILDDQFTWGDEGTIEIEELEG